MRGFGRYLKRALAMRFCLLLLLTTLLLSATELSAAIIITTPDWAASAVAQTVDVTELSARNGRSILGTRRIRQTFQVGAEFVLGQIHLSTQGGYQNASPFTIKFLEVFYVNSTSWSPGTQIGSTITVGTTTPVAGNDVNLLIALSPSEQFTIPQRNTGSRGYAMEIALVSSADPVAFTWAHAFDGTNHSYGRYYTEGGTAMASSYDMGLALSQTAIPEPSTFAIWSLLALCGIGIGWRRRRKA